MAKTITTYKTECDSVSGNKNSSVVRFVIEGEPIKGNDGKLERTGKTVIQAIFTDPNEAMKFKNGKPATITIEQ